MRVVLFKDSRASFLQALEQAGVPYEERQSGPGAVMASGSVILLAQTAAVAGAVAGVLVAWIKARASRKVMVTLKDRKVLQLDGYTVEEVKELLSLVEQIAAIDTQPAE